MKLMKLKFNKKEKLLSIINYFHISSCFHQRTIDKHGDPHFGVVWILNKNLFKKLLKRIFTPTDVHI